MKRGRCRSLTLVVADFLDAHERETILVEEDPGAGEREGWATVAEVTAARAKRRAGNNATEREIRLPCAAEPRG
jgi:hypothetical protein